MTVFEKITKINPLLGGTAILIGAAAWFHPSVAGSDLWWHLAGGREIWSHGGIPEVDPFSHTALGQTWTNHEWLWEALYWPTYTLHPDAVPCLNLAVLVVSFGLVAWVAWKTSGSLFAAGLATWLAAAASHWFLDIRPHLASLLFVAVVLVTREKRWAPFLWPPLFALWVNVHGGFVFGIGVIGLHVLFETGHASLRERRVVLPRALWIGLSLAAIAILLNPWGYRILEYPLAYLDPSLRFRSLIEWNPPGFGLDPRFFQGRFAWMTVAALLGVPFALRRAPYLVALAFVTFLMATTARRFIPLFSITATPVAAIGFAEAVRWAGRRRPELAGPRAALACSLLALVAALVLWRDVRFFPEPLYRWTQSELYPAGAVRYLNAFPEPPARLFNLYNWGGYLMLHAPGIPVFIDGRANTLYDEQVYGDYLHAVAGGPGWPQILRRYKVDAVLVPRHTGIARALGKEPERWQVAYVDLTAMLFLPKARRVGEPRPPSPEHALRGTGALPLMRGTVARDRGDLARARREFEEAVRLNPLLLPAYGGLIAIGGLVQDRDEVEHWSGVALDVYPRSAPRVHSYAALAWQRLGNLESAVRALHKAVPRGPFQSPARIQAKIRQFEARLRAADTSSGGEG